MITCWRFLGLIEVVEGFGRDRQAGIALMINVLMYRWSFRFLQKFVPDLYGLTAKPMRCGCMPSLVGGQACPSVLLF